MKCTIIIKHDTADNWRKASWYVLEKNELVVAYEGEKKIWKIGDGERTWDELPTVERIEEIEEFLVSSLRGDSVGIRLNGRV